MLGQNKWTFPERKTLICSKQNLPKARKIARTSCKEVEVLGIRCHVMLAECRASEQFFSAKMSGFGVLPGPRGM